MMPVNHPLSTVTRLWVKRHRIMVQFPTWAKKFSSLNVQNRPGDHPTSYSMDSGGIIPGVKQPECEADHSTEIKNWFSLDSAKLS